MRPADGTDVPVATPVSDAELGPMDVLVIEFPEPAAAARGLAPLVELEKRGVIRVLDLVVIRKLLDSAVELVALSGDGLHGQPELAVFDGVASGILDQGDVDQAAAALRAGSSAVLLLYEHRWAEPLMTTIRRVGGRLLASERVAPEAVLAALDGSPAQPRSDQP